MQLKNISEACQNNQKRRDTTERTFRFTWTVEGLKSYTIHNMYM